MINFLRLFFSCVPFFSCSVALCAHSFLEESLSKLGKPLTLCVMEEIVDLYNNGVQCVGVSEISHSMRLTKEAVHKVMLHFDLSSMTQPFSCGCSKPILITDDSLEGIKIWKLQKPNL